MNEAARKVADYEDDYLSGLISEDERYENTVEAWTQASDETEELVKSALDNYGGIAVMANRAPRETSPRSSRWPGMRGLMSNPKGRIIDLPIKSSFREGLTALEYFISTHGARKGLADTALRTADSGYLTRRLIDVAQEVLYWRKTATPSTLPGVRRAGRSSSLAAGATVAGPDGRRPACPPGNRGDTGDRNQPIDEVTAQLIIESGITEVPVRSPLTCESHRGICRMCYGYLPATGMMVEEGQAVGIIAAQSNW